jgi:hypothetical protein
MVPSWSEIEISRSLASPTRSSAGSTTMAYLPVTGSTVPSMNPLPDITQPQASAASSGHRR